MKSRVEEFRDRLIGLRAGIDESGVFGAREGVALIDLMLDASEDPVLIQNDTPPASETPVTTETTTNLDQQ
jgi:hypothetical protein